MKKSNYLIVILALGLLFVVYRWTCSTPLTEEDENISTSAIENIMTRTSVRSYSEREVSKEVVDTLLRAAMAAPTAGNKQPWKFIVIDKRDILNSISENFSSMKMASRAGVAVIMCGEPSLSFDGEGREYWVQDVSAATENLLLAAHAMGLGAVWCGIYPISDRVRIFSEMLNIPEGIIPMACVCIGYPDGETLPKDKWNPDNIHYNGWN